MNYHTIGVMPLVRKTFSHCFAHIVPNKTDFILNIGNYFCSIKDLVNNITTETTVEALPQDSFKREEKEGRGVPEYSMLQLIMKGMQ